MGLNIVELFMFGHAIPSSLINNPNLRIYWYIDYFTHGIDFRTMFSFFLSALAPNGVCFLDVRNEIFLTPNNYYVGGTIFDNTVAGDPIQIIPAPLGGAGQLPSDVRQGVNLFDITDITLDLCGNQRPFQVLDLISNGDRNTSFEPQGTDVIIRDVRIYVGLQGTCSPRQVNFGAPPSPANFRVEDFFISSIGEVDAQLTVPSAWRSNATTLTNDFRVTWFLRGGGNLIPLGASSRNLTISTRAAAGQILVPANYFVEARITRTANNSWVSTRNRDYNHNLAYSVLTNQVEIIRPEQNFITGQPELDAYFDPGETIRVPYQVTDPDNSALSASNLSSGFVLDQNGNNQIDDESTDLFVTNPNFVNPTGVNMRIIPPVNFTRATQATFALAYELLYAPNRDSLWFFVDSNHVNGNGTTSSYRRYIKLDEVANAINGQDTQVSVQFNFENNQGNGWFVDNQGRTGGLGWQYGQGPWVGNGGSLPQNADDLYSLISPGLPIGVSSTVCFYHTPEFTFNQSGGLLEYRFLNAAGAPISLWQDFPTAASTHDIYDPIPFPDNFNSYLSGKDVWMGMDRSSRLEEVDILDSFFSGVTSGEDRLQLRFVFQDPSLDPLRSDGPTRWEVSSLDYGTRLFLVDNVFGVDLEKLDYDGCDEIPALIFTALPPGVTVGDLEFDWFENLSSLHNGSFVVGGPQLPFVPLTNDEQYFVRARFTHPTTLLVTERVIPLSVVNAAGCTLQCLTMVDAIDRVLTDVSVSWPASKTITDCVEILNLICTPQRRKEIAP